MSRLLNLAQELAGLEEKSRPLQQRIDEVKAEMAKELNSEAAVAVVKPPVTPKASKPPKAKGKAKASTSVVSNDSDEKKYPSMRQLVQDILAKNTDGLDLTGLTREVHEMIQRGEYRSKAKKLHAVVSQATTALKAEKVLNHDRESKKYKLAHSAA